LRGPLLSPPGMCAEVASLRPSPVWRSFSLPASGLTAPSYKTGGGLILHSLPSEQFPPLYTCRAALIPLIFTVTFFFKNDTFPHVAVPPTFADWLDSRSCEKHFSFQGKDSFALGPSPVLSVLVSSPIAPSMRLYELLKRRFAPPYILPAIFSGPPLF